MDIEQLIFPFIMAVITNSIMIVIMYFLRKIPSFANLFSVWFMVILYLFCVLRIFLPIEFPGIQIKIEDNTVYKSMLDFFIHREADASIYPNTFFFIVIGIWIAGILVLSCRSMILHRNFRRYLTANGDYSTDEEQSVFSEVVKEVLKSDISVSLRKTDAVDGTFVIGLIHQTVFIPDKAYTDDELRMIFRHECMHIKNKDLWIKLLVQIYCCIFWWNPFAYLLKKDLDLTLELRCDLNTTKAFSDNEKLFYVETLKNQSDLRNWQKAPFVVSAELADGKKKDKLFERIKKVLDTPPDKAKQIFVNVIAAVLLLLIFVSSFIFIWQPKFKTQGLNEEYYELAEGGEVADESNAYLVRSEDGNYLFYFSDYPPMPVTKEEVEQGMYEGYPIYE